MGNFVQDGVSHLALVIQADQGSAHTDDLRPVMAASKASGRTIEPKLPVIQLMQAHVQPGELGSLVQVHRAIFVPMPQMCS
jgi:hypothetical protein